jgi:hypothetical protein
MKIAASALLAGAAVATTVGLASPANADNSQDVVFLAKLESAGIQSNALGIPMAHAICLDIGNGFTPAQETNTVYRGTDSTMTYDLSIAFTAASVTTYCPQYGYLGFYDSIYGGGGSVAA